MSVSAAHTPVSRASVTTRAAPSPRLWPALSRPFSRRMPPKGLDHFGEWITGALARARYRNLEALRRRARRIVESSEKHAALGEHGLRELIDEARRRAAVARDDPAAVDNAFAVAREAVRRTTGLALYVEQVMAALVMAEGCCAQLATGEGKTVAAILPAALDGWSGRGVHVLTVNDYLARRDAEFTGPAYRLLGLSVGVLQDEMKPAQRRPVYSRDVVYAADKQVIFDFLRDRLVMPLRPTFTGHLLDQVLSESPAPPLSELSGNGRAAAWSERVVQRGLHAAIIDEADSILIDEAITPAIIAQPRDEDAKRGGWGGEEHYRIAAQIARSLEQGKDYRVDHQLRRIELTPAGRQRLGEFAESLPPFWAGPMRREQLVTQAVTALVLYTRGDDYIIRDGEVVIVDRSTGRVLEGRQWQLGLHQAVEAKEGVTITGARQTSARTAYQRFFQRYRRLSGMTGTAWEVRHELWRDYRLPVVRIPTHKPVIREHAPDRVFADESRKFDAVADRVAQLHRAGRPVLIGTRAITSSERLGELLEQRSVRCRILNATREAEEAAIVAEAGRRGAVTVATNMAGRGTDIKLDADARALGGLVVIATERHDERRVDRQLYGRAGRQGDPGLAETYVSLDDQLIRRHGFKPLLALWRICPPGLSRPIARLLWWSAQHAAGSRSALIRREVARQDAMLEMSFSFETR